MMAKRKRRPYQPPVQGEVGPITPAQMKGAVILTLREKNGTEFRRKRRDHALEILHKGGKINARQCAAGLRLHELYCITEMGPDAAFTRVYVDTTANPSAVALAQAERLTKFIELSREIPRGMSGVVWHVAIKGRQLRDGYSRDSKDAGVHCAQLQVALDVLANHLRI